MSTVASVSLQTAVLDQVKDFADTSTVFSVHDVTKTIRNRVRNGELEIPETEVQGSSFRNDIPHSKVKALFDDLWRTGAFDPFLSLNRQFNGTYFEYTPTLNQASPIPSNVGVTPNVNYYTGPVVQSPTITPVTPAPAPAPAPVLDSDVKARITTYLNNCATRNFRPTLKQVQSGIKRNSSSGWTCTMIGDYIEQALGYTIVADPDFVSASQVAVV